MKRFYIPTSSLNFNNILSTESISPIDFYQKRDFGYSRWTPIKENDFSSVILLYEAPHIFERPQSDIEDHPLLIEYMSEEEYPIAVKGVYYTDKTIYLDPVHTRFIFFTQRDKDVALSLSESSLETKMLMLYQKRIEVDTSKILKGDYPVIDKSKINVPTNIEQIEFDRKVNKMKGFLYGYYIGAYLSLNDEQLLNNTNTLREISNIFASIISSLDKTPSVIQEERLSDLFVSLYQGGPIYKGLLNIIKDENKTKETIKFLEENHSCIFSIKWRDFVNEIKCSKDDKCKAITWVENGLNKQNKMAEDKRTPLSVDKSEIVTIDLQLDSINENVINDKTLMTIYKAWVNDILSTNEYNGKISSQRAQLSDALTIKARDILSDEWEDSPIRTFMNELRQHIRGGEFTQLWDNNVLSSIASCLIKGDDWEQLLLFMQSKGMTDYRLAFSFYGVLNGFANLTRDFTDLLLNLDKTYVWEVYREFAGQLLGVDIKCPSDWEKNTIKQTYSSREEKEQVQANNKESELNKHSDILTKVIDFIHSNEFGYKPKVHKQQKIDKLVDGLTSAFKELNDIFNKEELLELLSTKYKDYDWKITGKPYKELEKHLDHILNTHQLNLFSDSNKENLNNNKDDEKYSHGGENLHFYNDPSTIIELRDIIGENKVKKVQWFFNQIKQPRDKRYDAYKTVDENDDKWVINLFCKSEQVQGQVGDKLEEIRNHFYKKYDIQ